MSENDRRYGEGWQAQPFPGPPVSPYASGPPASPSAARGIRQVASGAQYRPPTSPMFTYSPNPADSSPPTVPPSSRPAQRPYGSGPPATGATPLAAPPRQSSMPGQAAASEVHSTIRMSHEELSGAGTPWTREREAEPSPFPEPGGPYAVPVEPAGGGSGALTGVLGTVVGLALGLVGLVMAALGTVGDGSSVRLPLLLGGLAVLAGTVALGRWTAAVPISAGLVGAVPGLFGAVSPETWGKMVVKLPDLGFEITNVHANLIVAQLGGTLAAATGVLIITAGVMAIVGRRAA
ncbi:MAG: hypothetical protein FWD11_09460 [Micrococcales bacterium]|nr:hypothetical protein [Micrococcales bacterium]